MTAASQRRAVGSGLPRPAFHFSAPRGWLSDPVGLVVDHGRYHLLFQHYPDADEWGPMHWGHAVSTDLVTWQDEGVALAPDEDGMIFSGSAVVDHLGSCGYPPGALVAAYTRHHGEEEVQCLAVSTDRGGTWIRHPGGPVLAPDVPTPDFRDPRLLRFEQPEGDHWVMLLAVGRGIEFYTSMDLVTWSFASRFSRPSHPAETWETPDLIRLVAPDGQVRWVLTVGTMAAGSESPTQVRYFVGEFDGTEFVSQDARSRVVDSGPDFYAAQAWTGAQTPTWTAWLGNWAYARSVPSHDWRGILALPRTLRLVDGPDGLRLSQRPVIQLDSLPWRRVAPFAVPIARRWTRVVPDCAAFDLQLELDESHPGLEVEIASSGASGVVLQWDPTRAMLTLDVRAASAGVADGWGIRQRLHTAAVDPGTARLDVRVIVDGPVVEVFAQDGTIAMSAVMYGVEAAGARARSLSEAPASGSARVGSLAILD